MKKLIKHLLINSYVFGKNSSDHIKWFLKKPLLPNNGKVLLHLGCGEINIPGFINVDKRPFPHIHFLSGVEKLTFIKDNTVDLIYISHCLEHISKYRLEEVLKEYYRILKRGGILRISVPDFKTMVDIYQKTGNILHILDPLFGSQEYKSNFHLVAFDYIYLESLLKKSSFSNVKTWNFGDEEYKSFPDWSGKEIEVENIRYRISLNVEASKEL